MLASIASNAAGMHDYNGPGAVAILFVAVALMAVILIAVYGRRKR